MINVRNKALISTSALAMSLLCTLATAQPGGGPPPASVLVDTATMQRVEGLREVTGELRATRRSLVATEGAGRVVQLDVAEGDRVESGGVLAQIDNELALVQVARADAEVAAAQATVQERTTDVEKADRDLKRLESLRERAAASDTEVEDARSDLLAAQARLEQARAQLRSAEANALLARGNLEDMTVKAPFAGRVVSKRTEIGQWAREGDPIVELVALETIEAWLDVPERYADRFIEPGMAVLVRVSAYNDTKRGRFLQVIPVMDPLSRIFSVRVELENPDESLRPGMSVVGLAPTGEDVDVLTVHKDAILRDNAGAFVYYNAGGVAAAARIRELFPVGMRVAIESPALSPGAEVVVEGNERLYPGANLIVTPRANGDTQVSERAAGN